MKNAKWGNYVNLVLGIWLFISPWLFSYNLDTNLAMMTSWNEWVVGAAVAIAAGLALQDLKPWEEWVNLVLGVWMILSPWIFGYTKEVGLLSNSIVIGAVVAIASGFALPEAQKLQHQR